MVQASVSAAGLGFSNGRIPAAFLVSVGNGQVMEPHAAAQLNAALADMHAHGFSDVYVLEGYRSYDTQVQLRDGYLAGRPGFNVAAVPGTSNHGDGRAADLAGDDMDSWDSAAQAYWQSIEAIYGFSSAQGRADGEAWHKVCTTWLDNITYTFQETTKPSTPAPVGLGEEDMTAPIYAKGDTQPDVYALYLNAQDATVARDSGFVYSGRRYVSQYEWAVLDGYRKQTGKLCPGSDQTDVIVIPQKDFDAINKLAGSK